MRQLSPDGQQAVNDIARRHGFSPEAVASMLESVVNGNGSMAQFNHPEFAGSGQWMRGGMIMLSDMFNNNLKMRIDSLCSELADLVGRQPGLLTTGSFQSQSQGFQDQQQGGGFAGPASLFVTPPGQGAHWWPEGLGMADSTGAQNNVRYAWFSGAHRLAIDLNGTVTVYDTLDHWIGGFSQQQSVGGSLSFTSQYGLIDVASLPVVSVDGRAPVQAVPQSPAFMPEAPPPPASPVILPELAPVSPPPPPEAPAAPAAPLPGGMDIFDAIERLADLKGRGILSEAEFAAKKAELLARL